MEIMFADRITCVLHCGGRDKCTSEAGRVLPLTFTTGISVPVMSAFLHDRYIRQAQVDHTKRLM